MSSGNKAETNLVDSNAEVGAARRTHEKLRASTARTTPTHPEMRASGRPGFYRLVDVIDDDMPTAREHASAVAEAAKERGAPERIAPRLQYTLTIVEGPEAGRVVPITSDEATLGRGSDCDVWLQNSAVSRLHARLVVRRGKLVIEDSGSANGTFVNGERVSGRTVVPDGSRVQLGSEVLLRVRLLDAKEATSSQRLFVAALRDSLTGLLNRHAANERLLEEVAFAKRHATHLSVLLIDIDHFKVVNDTHGHPAGDAVLTEVARALRATVRAEDVVARWGGEEFVVITRGIPPMGVGILAERLRAAVEKLPISTERGVAIPVTISIGVAALAAGKDVVGVVTDADVALYAAKTTGRNRVCHAAG